MLSFIAVILGAFCIFCIAVNIYYKVVPKEKIKQKEAERIRNIENEILSLKTKHICGLPIAQNTECTIDYMRNSIKIVGGGVNFDLDLDKVTDISTTTSKEIQKSYSSNAGGAVAGAMLFGPLGAIVGGMPKEKESKVVKDYMVITYCNDNEIKYISFEYNALASFTVGKFVNKFRLRNNKNQSSISL